MQMQNLLHDMRVTMEAASSRVAARLSAAEQQVDALEKELLELLEERQDGCR
jgi:chorismate mutase